MAALRGEPVDRVPISFWGHHYTAENSASGLAEETVRQARHFEWDFLKPQSRAQCFAEMWGLTYTPATAMDQRFTVTHVPVNGAADFERLESADWRSGALGEQLQALRSIRTKVGPDVPIIWTVFSPLMVTRYLVPRGADHVLEIARAYPAALEHALEAITQTLIGYARACLDSGADGIFYATNMATRGLLVPEECRRFQRPYDLRVLEAVAAAPFNVMHVCGPAAFFDEFADYPVSAFSWAMSPDNPSLSEGHRRTGKAAMGGIPAALKNLRPEEVTARAEAAIREMHGRWLLLAPDCSVDLTTPDALLLAAREATRTTSFGPA